MYFLDRCIFFLSVVQWLPRRMALDLSGLRAESAENNDFGFVWIEGGKRVSSETSK